MTKVRKTYNLLIQLSILVVSYFFIIKQVFWKQDLPGLIRTLEDDITSAKFVFSLTVVILLMILNWVLETVKWRKLIAKVEEVSFIRALEAVLTGVTISSFTPNRIGEYFGRVFILKKASHIEGILITVIGSMSQLLITVLTGSLALLFFFPLFLPHEEYFQGYLFTAFAALVIGSDMLLLGLFFNVSFLAEFKEKFLKFGLRKIRKYFRIFTLYSNRELAGVMGLSLARYLVFSTQYILLLWMMGVKLPFYYAYLFISLIYFVLAVIPTVALSELGIRGSIAIYFFGFYFNPLTGGSGELNFSILVASVLQWVINLGIPALTGSIFLFRLQFFRNNE
jgi:hypothetical protein